MKIGKLYFRNSDIVVYQAYGQDKYDPLIPPYYTKEQTELLLQHLELYPPEIPLHIKVKRKIKKILNVILKKIKH